MAMTIINITIQHKIMYNKYLLILILLIKYINVLLFFLKYIRLQNIYIKNPFNISL